MLSPSVWAACARGVAPNALGVSHAALSIRSFPSSINYQKLPKSRLDFGSLLSSTFQFEITIVTDKKLLAYARMEINSVKPLFGHTSEETAYLIEDYPYGFTLRCQKKVWIETDPKRGQRTVEMTNNPKRAGLHWNTPKKSTYSELCAAFIVEASDVDGKKYTTGDVGHVKFMRIGSGGDVACLERYNALYGPFETEYERKTMRTLLAMARAEDRLGEYNPPGNYYNAEERAAVIAYDKER
jgi:hypothetical protein